MTANRLAIAFSPVWMFWMDERLDLRQYPLMQRSRNITIDWEVAESGLREPLREVRAIGGNLPCNLNELWIPHVRIRERTLQVAGPHYKNHGCKLLDTGEVQLQYQIVDWFSCPFENLAFPFDVQTCTLTVEMVGGHVPLDMRLYEMSIINLLQTPLDVVRMANYWPDHFLGGGVLKPILDQRWNLPLL